MGSHGNWAARVPAAAAAAQMPVAAAPAAAPAHAHARPHAPPVPAAAEAAFAEAVRATLRDSGGICSISHVQADSRVQATKAAAGAAGHGNFRPALDKVPGVRTQAGEYEAAVALESMAPAFALPTRAELHAALRRHVARFGGASGLLVSQLPKHLNQRDWGWAPGSLMRECVAAGLDVVEHARGGAPVRGRAT